jgi:quinol monooxygenase YgiN
MKTLIATLIAKPEKSEALEQVLRHLVERARTETGCLAYHLHRIADRPNGFMFYEVWQSQEILDEHMKMPYLSQFWEQRMDYLEQDVEIVFLDMLTEFPVKP